MLHFSHVFIPRVSVLFPFWFGVHYAQQHAWRNLHGTTGMVQHACTGKVTMIGEVYRHLSNSLPQVWMWQILLEMLCS